MKTLALLLLTAALIGCGESDKKLSPVGTYIYRTTISYAPICDVIIYSDSATHTAKTFVFENGKLTKIDTMKF